MNKYDIGWFMPSLISLIFFAAMFYVTGWTNIQQKRLENYVSKEALKGNQYALRLIKSDKFFKYEKKKVVLEALKGNENALKMLNIYVEHQNK